jgi:quinol monooxygenase YgiN
MNDQILKPQTPRGSVTFTVELDLKPEQADAFCRDMLPQLLKQTSAFEGVQSVQAVRQQGDPNRVLFIDTFDSVEASQKYIAWRESRGDLAMLSGLLTKPAVMNVWPINIEMASA